MKSLLIAMMVFSANAMANTSACEGIDGSYPMKVNSPTGYFSHRYDVTIQNNGGLVSVYNTKGQDILYTMNSGIKTVVFNDESFDCSVAANTCVAYAQKVAQDAEYAAGHLITDKSQAEQIAANKKAIKCVHDIASRTGIQASAELFRSIGVKIDSLLLRQ